ncbi:hypothetical protein C8R43DRAFT_1112976 [Mycena crocata]|nr:hypothetical protein C8R43DRAFT_1112976 [Mycena crocata]
MSKYYPRQGLQVAVTAARARNHWCAQEIYARPSSSKYHLDQKSLQRQNFIVVADFTHRDMRDERRLNMQNEGVTQRDLNIESSALLLPAGASDRDTLLLLLLLLLPLPLSGLGVGTELQLGMNDSMSMPYASYSSATLERGAKGWSLESGHGVPLRECGNSCRLDVSVNGEADVSGGGWDVNVHVRLNRLPVDIDIGASKSNEGRRAKGETFLAELSPSRRWIVVWRGTGLDSGSVEIREKFELSSGVTVGVVERYFASGVVKRQSAVEIWSRSDGWNSIPYCNGGDGDDDGGWVGGVVGRRREGGRRKEYRDDVIVNDERSYEDERGREVTGRKLEDRNGRTARKSPVKQAVKKPGRDEMGVYYGWVMEAYEKEEDRWGTAGRKCSEVRYSREGGETQRWG